MQPRIERLFRLFVGACEAGKALQFLDVIARGIWNGKNTGWDSGSFLPDGLSQIGLNEEELLRDNPGFETKEILDANHYHQNYHGKQKMVQRTKNHLQFKTQENRSSIPLK